MAWIRAGALLFIFSISILLASCVDTESTDKDSLSDAQLEQKDALDSNNNNSPIVSPQAVAMSEYNSLKQAFSAEWIDNSTKEAIVPEIDLSICDYGSELTSGYKPSYATVTESYNPSHDPYVNLSAQVVLITSILGRYDIPKGLWQSDLNGVERVHLDWLNRQKYYENPQYRDVPDYELNHFVKVLTPVIEKLNSISVGTTFRYEPACGGTDMGVYILESTPKAASLAIMTKWNWLLCRYRKVDPYDTNQCRGWLYVSTPSEEIPGDMYYLAKWAPGNINRGSFDFSNRPDGEYKVTIRPDGVSFSRTVDSDWSKILRQ